MTKIYCIIDLESGSLKSSVGRAVFPLKPLREDSYLLLPVSGSSGHSLACDSITLLSASVFR